MYYNDYNRPQAQWDDQPTPPIAPEPQFTPPQPPQKKSRLWPKITALCLACAILGGAAGAGGAMLATGGSPGGNGSTVYESDRAPTVVNVSKITNGKVLTASEIYASNLASTVGITTQVTTNVFGQTVSGAASGSGFVLTTDGYVLTNYHVVDGASKISVTFADGKSYDAKLVGGVSENDIAVLKIEANGLTPVVIGDSSDMKVGEMVAAIGNPLGELTYTLTDGIVSALDRNITMSDGTVMNMLQTNCAINSGNSGGPLFNSYGEVIGITTAKYSASGSGASASGSASIEGIGFAIPVNDVIDMVKDIMENGYVTGKPYMGVTVRTVGSDIQQYYNIPAGAYVNDVVPGYCAEQAGLQTGDVITAIGNTPVDGSATLISEKNKHKAGDTVELTVIRNHETLKLTLTFDELTPAAEAASQAREEAQQQQQQSQQGNQNQDGSYYYQFPFGNFGW